MKTNSVGSDTRKDATCYVPVSTNGPHLGGHRFAVLNRPIYRVIDYSRLGLRNLLRVFWYRLSLKAGYHSVQRLKFLAPVGPFFSIISCSKINCPEVASWKKNAQLFSYWRIEVDDHPPEWTSSPLTKKKSQYSALDWWKIPDFDPELGDIKVVWELSRFDWVLAYAQQARSGDKSSLARLNTWLADWCQQNAPYKGPNWKCGQEASIRVMHLAIGTLILEQSSRTTESLLDLIALHLERIEPTISYAVGQENNHGTSEAAALFVGGSWLNSNGHAKGKHWASVGRKWLENRAKRLIAVDGSFSQYSLTYHRLMLDTFSIVEVWRRHLNLAAFSTVWHSRMKAAAHWLHAMTNPINGDGPNLGANDGARLLQLTDSEYRDFRPSVQLATVLFSGVKAYSETGEWDHLLCWLSVNPPEKTKSPPYSEVFDNGGFAVIREGNVMVMLRYPRFRFRPSHADALHLDLWLGDLNLLRDAGTYSYNTESAWLRYFPGTKAHNTIEFDGRDQMRRISRFLFGDWLKTSVLEPLVSQDDDQIITVGYRDASGARHTRTVCLGKERLQVSDHIEGFKEKAVLRWRLEPGDWLIDKDSISNGVYRMSVGFTSRINRFEIVKGWESRYYMDKQPLPVLEVEVDMPGTFNTNFVWGQ